MSNIAFRPVRGSQASIDALDFTDGYIYYTTDTKRIYMDKGNERILMSGGGSGGGSANGASIYYGVYGDKIVENPDTKMYHYPAKSLEDQYAEPRIDDMILDDSGDLYRIKKIQAEFYLCTLLPLSGSGSDPVIIQPSIKFDPVKNPTIVDGNECEVSFTVNSYVDKNGNPLADFLTVTWQYIDDITGQPYFKDSEEMAHGTTKVLELTGALQPSTRTKILVTAEAAGHEKAFETYVKITSVAMYLEHPYTYSPAATYWIDDVKLYCNAYGSLSKILEWRLNDNIIETKVLNADTQGENSIVIPQDKLRHGYHKIEIRLYQNIGTDSKPVKSQVQAEPLIYEIAVKEPGNLMPIIWLGEFQDTYYNYDVIQIPFLVYDPGRPSETYVRFLKNDEPIDDEERKVNDFSQFNYWQIADADLERQNFYAIECGQTEEYTAIRNDIIFTVLPDPTRLDFHLSKESSLEINFDPFGRSNNESAAKRQLWSYGDEDNKVYANFDNFNWYNNGWFADAQAKSAYLRISNGAKLTIPFKPMEFGGTNGTSNSIELAFKIRNIQKYNNLITNVTRYEIPTGEYNGNGEPIYRSDEVDYENFKNDPKYTNYDAYLQAKLSPDEYDNLKFLEVQKLINLEGAVFSYYSGDNTNATGMCVGTQDAFFSNGVNTVNVSFVEGDMVYLTFVYEQGYSGVPSKLYIYINGCITGVIQSTPTNFTIDSSELIFDSSLCDIDLYGLRVYSTSLDVYNVVTNHAVDKKDVLLFDQNKTLSKQNQTLQEYQIQFKEVEEYNTKHRDAPLMPYIIFDTTDAGVDDRLPFAKSKGTTPIRVEFINAPLDAAYHNRDLVAAAKRDGLIANDESDEDVIKAAETLYYKHHCPSWTSTLTSGDTVTIEVQGTSSEFYPRRNYKIKTKMEKPDGSNFCVWGDTEEVDEDGNPIYGWTEDSCLNIYMHKGPFEEVYAQDKENLKADKQSHYGQEKSRLADGWYMNNYTNPTDRWTMKVDYMESSGSYNAGFASMMGDAYTKHPLKDYLDVLTNTSKFKSEAELNGNLCFEDTRWEDFRTSLLGFPVMAFHKRYVRNYNYDENNEVWTPGKKVEPEQTETVFIGYYRMLLDKGSDQVLGFKAPKKVTHKLFPDGTDDEGKPKYKMLRDVAECWEFSTNARTFTSYRDPWNRVELSFKTPEDLEGDEGFIKLASGNIGGPMVLNHFEPRYFWAEDYLKNDENGLYNFGDLGDKSKFVEDMCEDIGVKVFYPDDPRAKYKTQDAVAKLMKNWEDVCKWIYSTNLQNVKSQGSYTEIVLGDELYTPGSFYLTADNEEGYAISNEAFDPTALYFKWGTYKTLDEEGNEVEEEGYIRAYVSDTLYEKSKYYLFVSEEEGEKIYSLCNEDEFNPSYTYYKFTSLELDEIAEIADLLVTPATKYQEGVQYYTYNNQARHPLGGGKTGAVTPVDTMSEDKFAANRGIYYVASPKTYDNGQTWYHYDTKEYRTLKFINELKNHFDLEYLATYFVMTEVFECYDSRGKNCMMASWGPQKEGGEYIWYPIFYDIDTQLGINNTGIPSFTFNVDATENKNYSTSDSILWNNFYKFFKGSTILNKYKNLRGEESSYETLKNPPLSSVNDIEEWYTFNYDTTNNFADKGIRPLIATNLDMFYKYITITNPKAPSQGVAYIPGADGTYTYDATGTYFYALQGDRSQSRRQFLTSRLDYIDSWLGTGNYVRGGNYRIQGRIAANAEVGGKISDHWIETEGNPYWVGGIEFGQKTYDFDSEYWLTLTPMQSMYVTAGDDSMNYPSLKYDGINPAKLKLADIESGIRQSRNYPEQLVYIYGLDKMTSFGDLYKMYWTEFFMKGAVAGHLTDFKLGYDGESFDESGLKWYNQTLNDISLVKMPLLKEANFSGLNITKTGGTDLDLSASEKLENFRAVRTSGLNSVKFAEGVALNTLYLPKSVKSLKLVQANALTTLIEESNPPAPINNDDRTVTPPREGLYIDGLFGNTFETEMITYNFEGGSLDYGTYKILKRIYDIIANNPSSSKVFNITMKDVNWTPYTLLTEGVEYDESKTYYYDDEHYGLKVWDEDAGKSANNFNSLVLNGKLYIENGKVDEDGNSLNVDIDSKHRFAEMLMNLNTNTTNFKDAVDIKLRPTLTGSVYVNDSITEDYIYNTLQNSYPNMNFFFNNVEKSYSARFLHRENGIDSYVKFKGESKVTRPSIQKVSPSEYATKKSFTDPFTLYEPVKTHYKFVGWSTRPDAKPTDSDIITDWSSQVINPDVYTYNYYAIFEIDSYDVIFYNGNGTVLQSTKVPYGTEGLQIPAVMPAADDSGLDLYLANSFVGYTDNLLTKKLVNFEIEKVRGVMEYWPVFEEVDVYTNIHPEYFSGETYTETDGKTYIALSLKQKVSGKLTIPKEFEDDNGIPYPVGSLNSTFATDISSTSGIYTANGAGISHVFFEKGTQIKRFLDSTFYCENKNTGKLIYVEFPDTLLEIQQYCFYRCSLLDYSIVTKDAEKLPDAVIRGKNITKIGKAAFQQAFKPYELNELQIGPSVSYIGNDCFYNIGFASVAANTTLKSVVIGTSSEPSKLEVNTTQSRLFYGVTKITIYSDIYGDGDEGTLATIMGNCAVDVI